MSTLSNNNWGDYDYTGKYQREMEEMRRMKDELLKTYRVHSRRRCRMCGGADSGRYQLCGVCEERVMDKIILWEIKRLIPQNDPHFCYDCYSHIRACECPKTQAIRKLKQ